MHVKIILDFSRNETVKIYQFESEIPKICKLYTIL